MKILDIGCYDEKELIKLSKKFFNSEIWGMDIDKSRIALSKNKIYDKNVHLVLGFSEKLPFRNSDFDMIYCSEVLEHVNNLKKSLLEIGRVTKPFGKVYFTFPNKKSEELLSKINPGYFSQIGHKRIVSPPFIISFFKKRGYKLISFKRYNSIEHLYWKINFKRGMKILDQNGKSNKLPGRGISGLMALLNQEELKISDRKYIPSLNYFLRPLSKLMDYFFINKRVQIILKKNGN